MSRLSSQSAILIALQLLTFVSLASFAFNKCQDLFIKQKTSLKNEVFDEVMDAIESRFLSEDMANMISKNAFEDVMKEVKALNLLQQKPMRNIQAASVLTDIPHVPKRKKKAVTKVSASDATPLHSTYGFDETKLTGVDNEPTRRLNQEQSSVSENSFERGLCRERPLLSPLNHLNNFQYNDRVEKIINILHRISTPASLNNFESTQYKAACWLLFDDDVNSSSHDEHMVQRYIMAVFLYATNQNVEMLQVDVCHTKGIGCNDQGQIISITLVSFGLSGTIPTEISQLRFLESLDLGENHLKGTIPLGTGLLLKLKVLNLKGNALTGTIPTTIGMLHNLVVLDLSVNELVGSIPSEIGQCNQLEILHMDSNNLQGSIPPALFDCSRLLQVRLGNNSFTGSIPSNIDQIPNIKQLWGESNYFTGTLPTQMGALSSIFGLDFSNNQLEGTIPSSFNQINSLRFFRLNRNLLTGTIPDLFDNMTKLVLMVFSNNQFSGQIPSSLWDTSSLHTLILESNELQGTVPDTFCTKISQEKFLIDNLPWFHEVKVECQCCGSNPGCHLWNVDKVSTGGSIRPPCPETNTHNIDYWQRFRITDTISNITLTEFLRIGNGFLDVNVCLSPTGCYGIEKGIDWNTTTEETIFDDPFPFNYDAPSMSLSQQQQQCNGVSICETLIDSSHPKRPVLNHITQLAAFNLSLLNDPTSFTYQALCWIMTEDTLIDEYEICDGTLIQRYVMALFYIGHHEIFRFDDFSNQHTCEWPGITCGFNDKFIQEINLSNTNLQGSIITELGLLQGLEVIDLSSNRLTGSVVKQIEYLIDLKTLNLANNKLDGTIDPIMSSTLMNLRSLDLSNNLITGIIPEEVFQPPLLQHVDLGNNLFVGSLSNDIVYSPSLEHLNVSSNLLQGTIVEAIFKCNKLGVLDMSRNSFVSVISPSIGDLKDLRILRLNENKLSGSIPVALFNTRQIQELLIQFNKLTGSIPKQIGNLKNVSILTLNHNSLKGTIPKELQNLQNFTKLHLHHNQLVGKAPDVAFQIITKENYITDCGNPSFLLGEPIECETCTMCCNSEELCQAQGDKKLGVWKEALLVALVTPLAFIVLSAIVLRVIDKLKSGTFFGERDPAAFYDNGSVYCFIFSNRKLGWVVYFVTATIQLWLFATYMNASNVKNKHTDFQFNFRCLGNSLDCRDGSTVGLGGWILFFVVLIFYLGRDIVMSCLQLLSALILGDIQLLVSGSGMLALTLLAIFTSFRYNLALAAKNTDLVTNAVILLFINDMDEHCLSFMEVLAPGWTKNVLEEIESIMDSKRRILHERPTVIRQAAVRLRSSLKSPERSN